MTQFLRDQASDSEEVVTPLMLDGTYLSRNFATLGPLTRESAAVCRRHCLWSHRTGTSSRDVTIRMLVIKNWKVDRVLANQQFTEENEIRK